MNVRSIRPDELNEFVTLSNYPDKLYRNIEGFWDRGESRPEYCFVLEVESQFRAGLVYLGFPTRPKDLVLWEVFLPVEPDWLKLGLQILAESRKYLIASAAERIEVQVSSLDGDCFERRTLLSSFGFELVQEKYRFEIASNAVLPACEYKLKYISLAQYGEQAFIRLIEEVTHGTFDRLDRLAMLRRGSYNAAEDYFKILKFLDDRPNDWMAAVNETGTAVGLIVPQQFSKTLGALNYVGVIPEFRGCGYSAELLHYGTKLLLNAGMKRIIGDIDIQNRPLIKALTWLGFENKCNLYGYQLELIENEV